MDLKSNRLLENLSLITSDAGNSAHSSSSLTTPQTSAMSYAHNVSKWNEKGVPEEGVSLSVALGASTLSEESFLIGVAKLAANFGVDYMGAGQTPETLKIQALHEVLIAQGWTDAEFRHRMQQFLSEQRFAGWTVADFISAKRPKVYPHSWYVAQLESARQDIGAYRIPELEKPVFGWKHECDAILTPWTAPKPAPALPEKREPISDETRGMIAAVVQVQKLQTLNRDLEMELEREQLVNTRLRHRVDMAELQLQEVPVVDPRTAQAAAIYATRRIRSRKQRA